MIVAWQSGAKVSITYRQHVLLRMCKCGRLTCSSGQHSNVCCRNHAEVLEALKVNLGHEEPSARGANVHSRYSGHALLSVVLAGRELKNPAALTTDMLRKLTHMLPAALRSLVGEAIRNNVIKLPVWDSRLILVVDSALMLFRRRRSATPAARYLFADSSPQAGHDWLITRVRSIEADRIACVFEAMSALTCDMAAMQSEVAPLVEEGGELDEPALPFESLDRASLYQLLHDSVSLATLPPMSLGLGRTSLVEKVMALLYAVFLEVSFNNLFGYLESCISITTDMGVELGIGDFMAGRLTSMLPPFVLDALIEDDTGAELPQRCEEFLFSRVLTVSGVLHIFSNASKDLYRCLECWEDVYASLKVLEKW